MTACLLPAFSAPPSIEIEGNQVALTGNTPLSFSVKVNLGGDDLAFSWGHQLGACATPLATAQVKQGPSAKRTYEFEPQPDQWGPICVWVQAEDEQGRRAEASTTVEVPAPRPTVLLEVTPALTPEAKVPLGSEVRLMTAAMARPEQGQLTPTLVVLGPSGKPIDLHKCGSEAGQWCFRALEPGPHKITFVVHDAQGLASEVAERIVNVDEDQPPCLYGPDTPVLVWSAQESSVLEVQAVDDLDSSPPRDGSPSLATFRWWRAERAEGDWERLVGRTERQFVLDANSYKPADTIWIRAEASDRVERPAAAAACGSEAKHCPATGSCKQRLTWRVDFK